MYNSIYNYNSTIEMGRRYILVKSINNHYNNYCERCELSNLGSIFVMCVRTCPSRLGMSR